MTRFFRQWHRWVSIFIAIPFLITISTGLLLISRGFNTWVQPNYPPLKSELLISFDQILQVSKQVSEAQIQSWSDVSQIDIRPSKGNIRVRSHFNNWEIQIDGATGSILTSAPRRVSWLVSIHEGAFFGPAVRYGVFLPSAIGVLFLLISGLFIFFQPMLRRKKRI